MPSSELLVRPAALADAAALADVYAGHVLRGTATFELDPPDEEEMRMRVATVSSRGMPWLVAEREGRVIGYAYCGPFHPRAAWRHTCEDSIYVHEDHVGTGAGRALLAALIEAARGLGFREMVAVIGDADNAGSIGLHAAFDFAHVGTLRRVGLKFDRWLDVVYMQRSLVAEG